jgi:hypothetical protein
MPIFIALKEPRTNLIVAGEIKDNMEKEYDEIFSNGVIMMKDRQGMNVVVPIWKESNIAFMREVTEKEVKENEELQEKMQEEAEKKGGGQKISMPGYSFVRGNPNRGGGGRRL